MTDMKKLLSSLCRVLACALFLSSMCSISVVAHQVFYGQELENILQELDMELDRSGKYVDERLKRIDFLHKMNDKSVLPDNIIYDVNRKLYDEYMAFQFDSAMFYLNENLRLTEKMSDELLHAETLLELGNLYTKCGMYLEAREVLNSQVDTSVLDEKRLIQYYLVQYRFYRDFREYSQNPSMTEMARKRLDRYCSAILSSLPEDNEDRMSTVMKKALDDMDFELADSVNSAILTRMPGDSHDYAEHAYYQAIIDFALGRNTFCHWYARSAIADIKTATKDNASIACLARQLFEDQADLYRAFRYIMTSMDDAIWYNAKLRLWQVAKIMPVIEKSYHECIAADNRMRLILTIIAGISSVLLLVFALWSYSTYKKMRKKAEELKVMNARLSELNAAVSEANSIKEEYIALFLTMCSDYIDKLIGIQQDIKRKLAVGMEAELQQELSSSKLMKQELDNFYNMFDTAFLKIYPNFVEEFNMLLREEERIVLPKDALLNTELRIFALIRLGITDSTRIAVLLRYSVQTIYNYRLKIKKRSKFERDDFETKLMAIGAYTG